MSSHSYSRDKLEESRRRKRAQQAAQQQRVNLPSAKSWLGVTPSQVAKPAQQTAPKTTVSRPAVQSSAGWKGVTPSQVAKPAARQTAPKAAQTAAVKQLPTFSVGQSLAQRTQQNIRNDNTRRARAARAREGQRQAAQANAAALKKDRAALAANSLKWHQTSDAAVRQRLEAENSAIRARRGYAYDSRTGSTYDSKGNELSLAARQIYGGRAETAKQFRDVAQTKDFVRDTSRTASQPSILDVARGVTADNPHYAIKSGQKAHSIIANLLNRSDETWSDVDTKARDEARDALQKEMQAIYQQYGATYQPRLSADETVKDLALRGADEQTLEYVRENLRLRDASDRLGQGLTAVGKRLEASIPSFVDTVKQAISNQSKNKENEAFTRLEEQEKQLELQLQNMQSQDENGRVPADYQEVYDQLQRVREEKNSLKVEKGVDQNLWSQKVLREANEAQANAEAGLAPAPRWVAEQAISLASNAPTMAASAVPVVGPALGSLVMGAQAAGQRAFELNEQGKSAGEALGRGTVSGIIEAATEKLPLERMAEILHSGGANAVKNILRQMGTEATEEGVSYFLNYVSDLAAADPDAKFSLAELAQSAAGGAFGGLVFGAAGTVGAKLAQRNEGGIYDDTAYERVVVRSLQDADAQLRAARSLPEGAGREAAMSAARDKMSQTIADFVGQQAAESAERSAAYDGGLSWDMSAKENKGINQTLDGRLQLPGLLSDDTLVANSIRQNAGNSNTSDTNTPLSEAMQYGKTPEQAMMEAKAKAEGERVREAMNRPEMHEARRIAERLGAKFEVADLGTAGGKYENGTITINPHTENPVRQVLVHELTHHLENSGAYADLQAAALRAFSEEQGVSADVLRQNITKLYAERGVTLDQDGANRELTAAFCENRLFKDENSIQRLAQTDVSLFQRIRQWLSDLVIRLRGTEEQKRVLEVQRLYEKAARNVGAVQDRGAQYTFGREYDNETLAKAVQMEREGADKDTIWNTLGVIRDTKGNWINEIDDSQMNYDEFGLHQLRKNADFRRLEELQDKANATAENFGYSPEEYAEWETLTDKYDDAVWDDKYMLRDYLKHDELFKRYPSLRIASLVFEPMRAGERGYYNRSDNSIHVNELLKSEPESTLLHEIQHFVQGRDNRPGGANPEYWRLMNESSDEWIDRNLLQSRKQKIIERMNTIEEQVGYSDFYDSLLEREEKGELTSEQVDELDREFIAKYPELEGLRNELYNDIYMKLKELGKGKRDPNELYRNTAGEIEARETASRRKMTAEERRQKTPDLGWDRAVFAEDAGTTKNQGQKNKTQTWHQNPDVSRSSSNLDISSVLRNALDGNTFVQNTFGFTPEQIAKGTVPLTDAMQYGKTPEQAVMEARVKRESGAKHAARELYRNIVSGQAEIERFAQMQKKMNPDAPDANDLAQINRVAGSTVDTIAEKALVDRKGDAIGKGWLETVGGLSKEQLEELNLYRLHKHNVDRMSIQGKVSGELGQVREQYEAFLEENPEYATHSEETIREIAQFGEPEQQIRAKTYLELKTEMNRLQQIRNKPVLARKDKNAAQDKPYTAAESEKILREMDEKNPQLAEWTAQAEGFHDAFMREWVVGSGLMSEEQYERLKTYYPHYVQTYRAPDSWGGGTDTTRRGSVNTGSPTKQAIGSLKEIIPFEDAEMMQVNSLVKNARRNELFRNIYEFAQAHPEEAASYVRIINTDEDMNTQPLSFDNLTGDMAEAAMSDQGGIYTIHALEDGKPITMQVNSAFYAGLQNLFGQDRGASDTFMKKTFGTMTNAFKVFTTGKNPLFFLTNLPKDFQTAYINTTSSRKTLLTWLADVGATVKHMAANDADWQAFQALGGAGGGFYHNEKGFSRSAEDAGKHQIIKKIWAPIDAVSENTEALWRFNEYRAAVQRYGDTEAGRAKAIQAAADVTTNFSRTAPATKAAENYCAYLNASVQGLDKIARQVKEHPILTARRAAEIIALPTLLLYLINKDDDDYKNLNNRTKDNYYCIPIGDGDFLKIPKSREYGVAMGALLERFFRLAEGEEAESAFKGIGEQFMTNLAPSNPVTDNILKTVFIDLPTNRDFAGRSIVPERMEGLSPENQYDYTTSGAGMAIAKGWNATLGRVAGKISPIQADYLIDSNLGFVGDAIIGATTDPKSPAELAKEMQENPVKTVLLPVFNTVKQKFTANPLYQSGVTDAFYDELDAAQRAANDKNLTENLDADIVTPEETYYSALNKSSSEISELRKQERTILADKSLSAEEQEEKVRDIRRQIIEIAKNAKEKAQKEREEYEKTYVPELSPLSEERQKDGREAMQHGLSAEQFVKWDSRFSDLKNKKDADGKHIYSEAEARGRALKEVMADDTLRSGEKQALADYVLISTMGDNDKEKWNDEVKGKVNASDYVRFKSDVAEYEKEFEGTGADNAANVKRIIDGYENLNAEQKSVLMSVYSDNASKNLYHVSTYEQQIDKNGSFYKGLSQSGRDNLRGMLNEYESAVNDGKELKEWKAKAYMAEKEADISPATYAMFYIASQKAKGDKSNVSQKAAEAAVNAMDGLTQHQKAYLYQSVNSSWKKNPFGSATVGKYESGAETGINPVEGSTVSSPFGPRQTFTTANGAKSSKNHHSIDLAAAAGTPIKAFQSGKVTANGWVDGYGWTIEVTHPNGLISQYHHMQNSSSVAVGTEVKQGQTIGNVGSTGNSTGPHLDLSIIKDGKYIDPASVIPALKDSASGYISTDAASYGALTAAARSSGKKSSGGSSGLRKPSAPKGLSAFR